MHPNSLKNIQGKAWNSETAKQAQLLGAAKKVEKRMLREELKKSMEAWRDLENDVLGEELSSVNVLRILMHKALREEEYDVAADLAKSIAEFEQPKLARIEQKIEETSIAEMSDEELQQKLNQLSKSGSSSS